MVKGTVRTSQASRRADTTLQTKQQGQRQAATAPHPQKEAAHTQLVFDLSVQALQSGCVNAFVEFFALSHRDPVCVDALANTMFSIPDDKLTEVKAALVRAEKARRAGEYRDVYECYENMAAYFEEEKDINTALHFYQVGLDSTKQSSDKELEGMANEKFGLAYERLGETSEAIHYHEVHLRLAEATRSPVMKRQAHSNLIRVYMVRASQCEQQADYWRAKELYEKSMNTARANGDTKAEGDAYHHLGNINVLLGDLERALDFQKRFLLVSKEIRDPTEEGKAQVSLAELQEELGQVTDAINCLQRSLEIAEDSNDERAICEACTKLGLLHNKQGNFVTAVHYLQQNYRVAQKIGDMALIDEARILVGIAQGNQGWANGFVKLVDSDIDAVVQWKSKGTLP